MGRSGSEGFGCDNTDEPSTRVEPEVVLLPDGVDDPADPLAWVDFEGRWGERHASPEQRSDRAEHQAAVDRAGDVARRVARQLVRRPFGRLAGRATDRDVLQRRRVGFGPVHQVRGVPGTRAVRRRRDRRARRVPAAPDVVAQRRANAVAAPAAGGRDRPRRRGALPPAPRHVRRRRRGHRPGRRTGVADRRGRHAAPRPRRPDRGLRHRRNVERRFVIALDHRPSLFGVLAFVSRLRGGRLDRRRTSPASEPTPAAPCGRRVPALQALGAAFVPAAFVIIVLDLFVIGSPDRASGCSCAGTSPHRS